MDGFDDGRRDAMQCRSAGDRAAIDLNDAAAVAAWCAELQISEEALHSAVETVGGMPAAVRFFVQGSRRQVNEPTAEMKATQLAIRALRGSRAGERSVKQPGRRAKPLDLDRLATELRTGSRSDQEFVQSVARFCAKVADQCVDPPVERPGETIRNLFGIK